MKVFGFQKFSGQEIPFPDPCAPPKICKIYLVRAGNLESAWKILATKKLHIDTSYEKSPYHCRLCNPSKDQLARIPCDLREFVNFPAPMPLPLCA